MFNVQYQTSNKSMQNMNTKI